MSSWKKSKVGCVLVVLIGKTENGGDKKIFEEKRKPGNFSAGFFLRYRFS